MILNYSKSEETDEEDIEIPISKSTTFIKDDSKTPQKYSRNENFIFFSKISNPILALTHITSILNGLDYLQGVLDEIPEEYLQKKEIKLAPNPKKPYTLLLDLDETLIHSCENGEHTIDLSEEMFVKFNIRPNTQDFLQVMSEYFEIYIFTASKLEYAEAIIDYIDPSNYIEGIIYRNQCLKTKNGKYIKDLRIIANRDIKKMILVDNCTASFGKTIENGVPICDFINDKKDDQLLFLQDYLIGLTKFEDIRKENSKNFNQKKLNRKLNILL